MVFGSSRGHYGAKMKEHRQQEKILEQLFETYDTDHSNSLDEEQLRNLLKNLSNVRYNTECTPTDDDVKFIIQLCDKDGNKAISKLELKAAVAAWDLYVQGKDHTDAVFDRYDTNQSGRLSRLQLHAFLLDILAQEEEYGLSQEDVDFVLERADITKTGSVMKMELAGATSAFMVRRAERNSGSSCCMM